MKTYTITADFGSSHYALTGEGFKDSCRSDALSFSSKATALDVFNNLDAESLERDGFKGYQEISLCINEFDIDADEEIITHLVTSKIVTVDAVSA